MSKNQRSTSRDTARKRTRLAASPATQRRHAVDPSDRDFMTAAEARGEAAYLVTRILLRRIPRSMCRSVLAQAYAESDALGVEAITSEVEGLFSGIEFDDQA